MKKCKNCGKSLVENVKFCTSCGSSEIVDTEKQVSEYKRICNQCGTTWHSLVARENELKKGIGDLKSAGTQCCNMCNDNTRKENTSKLNSYEEELNRLQKCPKCNSANYKEELLTYEK